MKYQIKGTRCTLIAEPGERFKTESAVYFALKKAMQADGLDVIKKRMSADGHMYGDGTLPYVRDRKWKFAIYDGDYAIRDRDLAKALNQDQDRTVNLIYHSWSV